MNSTLNELAKHRPRNLPLERVISQPLRHLLKVNKNAKLFKLNILPGTNFWGTPWRTRNHLNLNGIDSRYETCLVHQTPRVSFSSLSNGFQSTAPA